MSWSSGTNTIQEVDTNKSMTLQMIKLKKQGGGTELFVRKNDVKLGTKSVTKNGTYKASDVGKYGFSQFSVNVKGGNGSADSHGKPTGGDIKPGGAGSAVVGTDPTTGNEQVVGVDEGGNLVNTPVPSGIKIVTPPTKTDYVYQEDMDYSGLVVKMINRDGTTFTDVGHPNGYLAVGELVLPVEKAPATQEPHNQYPEYADSGRVTVTSVGAGNTAISDILSRFPHGYADSCGIISRAHELIAQYPGCMCSVLASGVSVTGSYAGWAPFDFYIFPDIHVGVTINLNNFYRCIHLSARGDKTGTGPMYFTQYNEYSTSYAVYEGDNTSDKISTINAVSAGGTATIPVKWTNSYTGATHQDTFEITSTPADGDAHTSTGSSGTGGSGGGGSF